MRFWGLQVEQYGLVRQRLIPVWLYTEWVCCRYQERKKPMEVGGVSYMSGWDIAKGLLHDQEFIGFMEAVLHEANIGQVRERVRREFRFLGESLGSGAMGQDGSAQSCPASDPQVASSVPARPAELVSDGLLSNERDDSEDANDKSTRAKPQEE